MDYPTLKTLAKCNTLKFLRAIELRRPAAADAEERLRQTMAVLNSVDRRTREIYVAHRGGATYAEIAAHWGISYRVIRRHVARALLVLMDNGERDQ